MKIENLKEFVGNIEAIEKIKLKIAVASKTNKSFPHSLIAGCAGIGKTTLSELIAKELGAGFIYINSTTIKNPISFRKQIAQASQMAKTNGSAIIMLDECHALPRQIQDNLLSLLEHPAVLCTSGFAKDPQTGDIIKDKYGILQEKLNDNISFMMATTHPGNLTDALVSRLFNISLFSYTVKELAIMAKKIIPSSLSDKMAIVLGRIARSARDIVQICGHIKDIVDIDNVPIDSKTVTRALKYHGYEHFGCTKNELKYIKYLGEMKISSLANISSYLNVSKKEVEEKIEPFLIRKKYLVKNTKGRQLTIIGKRMFIQLKKESKNENTKNQL